MSYLALYRRYRPDTFDKLVGQEHIVKVLVNQIETDRLGHAYLFTGTRGTGKTSAAKIFAKAINCEHPVNGSPCGKCAACQALSDPSNIDVVEIDAASNNGVNEIRDLREKVQYPPVSCRYKVYIVDEVHMLTGAAFNALLKTLEEPPKHAVFILATTEVHKIPATILSRCMRFDFRLIPVDKIAELISKIYDEEGKKYEKEAVFAIAAAGDGSIRDALSIADIAISYGTGKLTYGDVAEILGSANSELLYDFTENLIDGETGKMLDKINELASLGKSMGVLTKDVVLLLRDILVIKTCAGAEGILGLPAAKYALLKKIADKTSEERLLRAMEIFSDAENMLRYTAHPRVLFETAAIKAAKPQTDYNIDALLARVSALENQIAKLNYSAEQISVRQTENVDKTISVGAIRKNEDFKGEAPAVEKLSISSAEPSELKGRLLSGLRKTGSEMLWNVIQNVDLNIKGNVLVLNPSDSGDFSILDMEINRDKIKGALTDYGSFELQVIEPRVEKKLDAVDEATERIKKIFGDDIVIVKD